MADKKIIIGIDLEAGQAVKAAARLEAQVAKLATETSDYRKILKNLQVQESITTAGREQAVTKLQDAKREYGENSQEVVKARAELMRLDLSLEEVQRQILETSTSINANKIATADARKEQREFNKVAATLPDTLARQRLELSSLKKEIANFQVGVTGSAADLEKLTAKTLDLNEAIKRQEEGFGVFQRNVGDYKNAISGAFNESLKAALNFEEGLGTSLSRVGDALKAAGGLGIALFAAEKIAQATGAMFDYQQAIEKARREVALLTGATGDLLNENTALAMSIAQTFDVEVSDVLRSTNALSKQLGISFAEAGDAISKGFAAGANTSGDFLDQLREYPSQLRAVGLDAEQSIAIITQSVQEGVFSDKGVDAIKEAGLRLRELTPATREALDGIGLSSTAIEQSLRDGTTSLFDVIQQVGNRLGELPENSAEVGTAIADIFGGPGEDAGLNYLKLLGEIDTSLDSVIESGGEAAAVQKEFQETTQELLVSVNELAAPLDGLVRRFTLGLLKALLVVINVFKAIPELISENREAFIALGVALVTFNASAILAAANLIRLAVAAKVTAAIEAATVAVKGLNLALRANPIGIVITALAALAAAVVYAYRKSEKFRAVLQGVFGSLKTVVSSFVDGIKNSFLGLGNILIGALTFDLAKIKAGLKQLGEGIVQQTVGLGTAAATGFANGYTAQRDKDAKKLKEEEVGRIAGAADTDAATEAGKNVGGAFSEGLKNSLSVAGLNAQVTKLKEAFDTATTDAERARIASEIGALEARVKKLSAPLDKQKEEKKKEVDPVADEKIQKENIQRLIEIEELKTATTVEQQQARNQSILDLRRQLLTVEQTIETEEAKKKGESIEAIETLFNARRELLTVEAARANQLLEVEEIKKGFEAKKAQEEISYSEKREALAQQREQQLIEEREYRATLQEDDKLSLSVAQENEAKSKEEYNTQLQAIEEEHESRMREIRKISIELELEDEALTDTARLEKLAELAELEAEIAAASAQAVEDSEARKQAAKDKTIDKAKEEAEKQKQIDDARRETDMAVIDSVNAVAEAVKGSTEEQSAAYKAAVVIQKAAAIASTIIETQQRISAIALAADKLNLILPGAGIPYRIINTILAITQGAARIAAISGVQFAEGGQVDQAITRIGGYVNGASHAEGGIPGVVQGTPIEFEGKEFIVRKEATERNRDVIERINQDAGRSRFEVVRTYAEGGEVSIKSDSERLFVRSPRLGEANERTREISREYASGGMVSNRKTVISRDVSRGMVTLRKRETFRDGGSVSSVKESSTVSRFGERVVMPRLYREGGPAFPSLQRYETGGVVQPVAASLQQEALSSAGLADAVRAAMEAMPRPVVSVVEIADVANRVTVKEGRANL